MSNVALYRKYRPKNFDEVVGQEHIVSVLKNEAKQDKVSHAYLFAGSRGTGKTSVARIFANSLGVNQEDIYEMDAASNRGIDEIRELREAVNTLPYSSKYKVYILDEAHMLTRDAWNALLKTLEEPPAHVIFIMATTEQHKLPDTVLSRCEIFNFKKPSHADLTDNVMNITKKEGFVIEKSSASLIATLSDGSFRDALSTLQKTIHSSKDKKLSADEVAKIVGAPKSEVVINILRSIAEKDTEKGLEAVRTASSDGSDIKILLKLVLRSMRFLLLLRFAKNAKDFIAEELGEKEFVELTELAKNAKNINSKTLLLFLESESRQSYTAIPELPIEIAIIESTNNT